MNNRIRDIGKTRAITQGFKLFGGLAAVALTAALITGFSACKPDWTGWSYPPVQCTGGPGLVDSVLGPITLGWKGAIGDHFVFTLFVAFAAVSLFVAGFLTAFRDADPRSVAEAARTDVAPPVNPPSVPSYWPALGALSVAMLAIGAVVNPATFVAGFIILGVTIVMWTLRTWAEHATGSDTVNEEVRENIAFGLEVPLFAVIVVGAVAISMSRVFLSVGRLTAVAVAGVVAFLFFAVGVAIAYIPKIGKNVVAAVVVLGAVLVVASGVVSASIGERDFEHHEAEEGHAEEGGDEPAPETESDTTTTTADAEAEN